MSCDDCKHTYVAYYGCGDEDAEAEVECAMRETKTEEAFPNADDVWEANGEGCPFFEQREDLRPNFDAADDLLADDDLLDDECAGCGEIEGQCPLCCSHEYAPGSEECDTCEHCDECAGEKGGTDGQR